MFRHVTGLLAATVLAAGMAVALWTTPAGAAPASFQLMGNPNPASTSAGLSGISCVSQNWCMAVGFDNDNGGGLAEVFDGTQWTVSPTPNASTGLTSVSCISTTWCMAVGGTGPKPLAERWNGSSWSVLTTGSPGSVSNLLLGVSCASTTFCVAVGGLFTDINHESTLIERWNGTAWAVAASPNPNPDAEDSLSSVSCTSPSSCMAVGGWFDLNGNSDVVTESWDGSSWNLLPGQTPPGVTIGLDGVSCAAANSCLAVGYVSSGPGGSPFTETWDGTAWQTRDAAPLAAYGWFLGVSCTAADSCIAVGLDEALNGGDLTVMSQLWDGASWTRLPDEQVPAGQLKALSCVGATLCNAVGYNTSNGITGSRIDSTYLPAGTVSQTVVSSSVNPALPGRDVTFTATVSGSDQGNGTVSFYSSEFPQTITGCASRPLTLSGNAYQAACTVNDLPHGTTQITAVFTGGGGAAWSSGLLPGGEDIEGSGTAVPLSITTTSLPDGLYGHYYSATVKASGGQQPYRWQVTELTLPEGLTFSSSGVLSGTPKQDGTFSVSVAVQDSFKPADVVEKTFYLVIDPFAITTTTPPDAYVGKSYSTTLKTTGGVGTLHWSQFGGSLPPGLKLSDSGVISGTPTATGFYGAAIGVRDNFNQTGAAVFINVHPITLTAPTTLPGGLVGKAYPYTTFKASGGKPTLAWTVTSGALPPGLKLSTSGVLSGTPSAAGDYHFSVTVTDASTPANSTTVQESITVAPMTITTTALPNGQVKKFYSTHLAVSGGKSPWTWTTTSGALPPGLKLATGGTISGTPTTGDTYTFTVSVRDGSKPSNVATQQLAITIT